jgi:hypothetical protein
MDYTWVWDGRFVMFVGLAFLISSGYYYVTDNSGISDAAGAASRVSSPTVEHARHQLTL